MAHLIFRNVNDAFRGLVAYFSGDTDLSRGHGEILSNPVRRTSRNGAVLVIDEPVTITYTHPTERVLFNAARDANPFFHLFESLWMLAGRNDVAPLAYYNSKIAQFSDDGKTFNGAYGYRWRHHEDCPYKTLPDWDQLDILVNHLKADPTSRRAVLSMWNVEDDLLKIGPQQLVHADGGDCDGTPLINGRCPKCGITPDMQSTALQGRLSKDVCCNLSVLFSLRELAWDHDPQMKQSYDECPRMRALDMTVLNRSNDLVWGLLGANYVHFTILQEYMAARLGAQVGRYHHVTNNLHAYVEREDWKPEAWLADKTPVYDSIDCAAVIHRSERIKSIPLVRDPETFERELSNFVRLHDGSGYYGHPVHHEEKVWEEPSLETVARPMLNAFHLHKLKAYDNALTWASRVRADDWRVACTRWIERRVKK